MGLVLRQLRTATLLAALVSMTCVGSTTAARRDSTRMKTILVLGDSLSDGFMLPRSQAYPALLAERLRREGMNFEVTNASQSGGTSSGGVSRITPHLKRPIDILVVQLGINDAFRAVPVSEIRANLQSIIDKTKQRWPECEIVIAGMQLPIETQDGYVRAFGQMYQELAERNNAALVPYLLQGVGGDPALNLPDRIHPNAAGQKILAENVWRALEPVARRVSNDTRAAAASRVP
jgi:acyl-CoA thioesterase-1